MDSRYLNKGFVGRDLFLKYKVCSEKGQDLFSSIRFDYKIIVRNKSESNLVLDQLLFVEELFGQRFGYVSKVIGNKMKNMTVLSVFLNIRKERLVDFLRLFVNVIEIEYSKTFGANNLVRESKSDNSESLVFFQTLDKDVLPYYFRNLRMDGKTVYKIFLRYRNLDKKHFVYIFDSLRGKKVTNIKSS